MELNQQVLLDELLTLKRENWAPNFPTDFPESFPNLSNLDSFQQETPFLSSPNPSLQAFDISTQPIFDYYAPSLNEPYTFLDGYTVVPLAGQSRVEMTQGDEAQMQKLKFDNAKPPLSIYEDYASIVGDYDKLGLLYGGNGDLLYLDEMKNSVCENDNVDDKVQVLNVGVFGDKKKSCNKIVKGQPSKNLMAERRRRKRLNDRLSMLRSIVPKISKMDRTSILADTIDYMKELLERINKLQEENDIELGKDQNLMNMSIFSEIAPNEAAVTRNSLRFDVERRNVNTQIEICCPTRPGLLVSTVNTLEALGLEIQQCVISCFNDFSMQASCSEALEQREMMSSEDIKQAIFRNAGYGGRF